MQDSNPKAMFGILIILLGLIFLYNNLGLSQVFGVDLGYFVSTFWPLLIILWGLARLVNGDRGAIMLLALGGLFQASTLYGWEVWSNYWPVLIVVAGLLILFRPRAEDWVEKGKESSDYIELNAIFSGYDKNLTSKEFKGGEINCIFGGGDFSLKQAEFDKAHLEFNAIFGGGDLIVPEDTKVEIKGTQIFGGYSNKTDPGQAKRTLFVEANTIFGGLEVKN